MPISDQCQRCVLNNTETCPFNGNISYDGHSCEHYSKGINLEKETHEISGTATVSAAPDIEQNLAASPELPSSEPISGWLKFFLIVLPIGAFITLGATIASYSSSDYSYIDIILDAILIFLSIAIVIRFNNRKPDSVFLAKTYLITCFCINVLLLLAGENTEQEIIKIVRAILTGVAWFWYLSASEQVNRIIPKSYRKLTTFSKWVLAIIIGLPLLGYGYLVSSAQNQYAEMNTEITTDMISYDEYTDGRIVFPCPDGFDVQKHEADEITLFQMDSEDASITLCSDYNPDFTKEEFAEYWEGWVSEDLSNQHYTVDRDAKITINDNEAFLKIVKYDLVQDLYWYYILIHHEITDKECVISYYTVGEENKVSEVIDFAKTVRFHK